MHPVIAIVGRPNVGKSTLFNYLTRTRDALVANLPGVTRDRKYGQGEFDSKKFIVIDTGGLDDSNTDEMATLMAEQTMAAINEATAVFFIVDARSGLLPADQFIANKLRVLNKPVYLLINKVDGINADTALVDFYQLGFPTLYPIAAAHGANIDKPLQDVLQPFIVSEVSAIEIQGIKIAVIGRPNVGKSTLVNRILGEERVLVYDQPGTTRDSISIPFSRRGKDYMLIDTAGVRRKRSVHEALEKFSIIKALQAIDNANVVLFVIDGKQNIADQDLHLLGYIVEAGKGLIICVNKWDGMQSDEKEDVHKQLDRRLHFIDFARIHYISALHGTGVGDLFASIHEAYRSATKKVTPAKLTTLLEQALEAHQPPAVHGRRIKLRYAHMGGTNPPVIVIHGNQTDALPDVYKRYLANYFRQHLHLMGTPLHIQLKSGENPYKEQKNELTDRQVKRRQRLMKHIKRSKK